MESTKADVTEVTNQTNLTLKMPETVAECHKMINVLLEKVNDGKKVVTESSEEDKEKELKEQKKLEEQRVYFEKLSEGAAVIDFIWKDLAQYGIGNRDARKRLIKEMMNKKFSKELIDRYQEKLDDLVQYISEKIKYTVEDDIKAGDEIYINNRKIFKKDKETVDGADFVKAVEEKVASGELKEE